MTKIEDYAFLSDTQTGALVSRDGCIDWLCFPRFDSAACFASLLGEAKNGHWRFYPNEEITHTERRYRGDALILETEIETASGAVRLIDFMPPRGENPDFIRIIEGLRGSVEMQMELIIRYDYGQIIPWVRQEHGGLEAIAGPDGLILRTPIETRGQDLTTVAEFAVKQGDRIPFVLTWFASHSEPPKPVNAEHALRDTEEYWTKWSKRCEQRGPWREAILRSLIVLKGLTYAPTGDRSGADDIVAGGNRWRTQLGLSLLLAARCDLHTLRVESGRILRRSEIVARMVAAGHRRRAIADANTVWRKRRAPHQRIRDPVVERI